MKKRLVPVMLIPALLVPAAFLAKQGGEPVPVEQEPLHKVMFQNDAVIVMHLILPPGERTQYHIHSHDRVAIQLSDAKTTQQKLNGPEEKAVETKVGDFTALTLTEPTYTHRVHNVGKTPYEVLDIELLQRPANPSGAVAGVVAGENPSARIYNWVLAPGASSPMHAHVRPYIIVATKEMNLGMTAPDGQQATHGVGPGDFKFINSPVTHTLANAGPTPGQIIEVELK